MKWLILRADSIYFVRYFYVFQPSFSMLFPNMLIDNMIGSRLKTRVFSNKIISVLNTRVLRNEL